MKGFRGVGVWGLGVRGLDFVCTAWEDKDKHDDDFQH